LWATCMCVCGVRWQMKARGEIEGRGLERMEF
jgi:hypothetical protein